MNGHTLFVYDFRNRLRHSGLTVGMRGIVAILGNVCFATAWSLAVAREMIVAQELTTPVFSKNG